MKEKDLYSGPFSHRELLSTNECVRNHTVIHSTVELCLTTSLVTWRTTFFQHKRRKLSHVVILKTPLTWPPHYYDQDFMAHLWSHLWYGNVFHSNANKTHFTWKVVHLASFWKWGFLEPVSGLYLELLLQDPIMITQNNPLNSQYRKVNTMKLGKMLLWC